MYANVKHYGATYSRPLCMAVRDRKLRRTATYRTWLVTAPNCTEEKGDVTCPRCRELLAKEN